MTLTTSSANASFLASAVGDLIVQPVQREALALQLGTVISVTGANSFRVPIVTADASAAWVAEGGEIAASDANLGEATTDFYKLAGLQIVTRELADDSNPAAAELVGAGLARDIAKKIDAAFF
ncbi:phage major capsid protein, partial [Bacillus cereus]|uniref:phage major capsid protein n=1 Tax=Bacillus cereus TaxID=1396 RepID=UPI0035F817A4